MATGLPGRVVIVLLAIAAPLAQAQVPTVVPADRPPVTSPTAPSPVAAPTPQPTIAQVTERRQVAVIDLSTDPAAEILANDLYNVLVNHPDLRPLANPNFVGALKGAFADEERPFLETARRAKQEAEDAIVQLDFRSAELAAERGTQALHNVRPSPDVLGLYADLAFHAGQAALKQRRPNDASLLFGLSRRLDANKQPDPARYEPEIIEAYQLAVSKIPVQAKLEVKGTGTVWIDGIDRGPAGVFDVSHGLHLVQLSGSERETRGRQVNIPSTSALEIEAAAASEERKVERLRLELAQTRDAAARAGAVKKLATLLGVGDAVLIEKSPDGTLRVQTWRNNQSGFSAWVEHREEAPGELLVPLAPPRKIEPPRPPEVEPLKPVVVEKPFYRKPWFYGSVTLGIVAAAISIYVYASVDRMTEFDRSATWETE